MCPNQLNMKKLRTTYSLPTSHTWPVTPVIKIQENKKLILPFGSTERKDKRDAHCVLCSASIQLQTDVILSVNTNRWFTGPRGSNRGRVSLLSKYLYRMTHANHRRDSIIATGLDRSYYDRRIISRRQTYAITAYTLYAVIIVAIIKGSAVK
jgi:hypothetical protein